MTVRVDGFVFDLDGTVYLGDAALPGSVDGIRELRRRGKRVLVREQQTAGAAAGVRGQAKQTLEFRRRLTT